MRFSGFFAVPLGITCLALEASAFVFSRAPSSTLTAGSSAVSSMSPVDVNELSLSSSGNDAVADIRGGDLSPSSPSAVPKKSPQTLLVGIYFFLWAPSSTLTAGSSAVSSMSPVVKKSSFVESAVVPCWGGDVSPPYPPPVPKKSTRTFLVCIYFFLWYTLNIAYNITNKITLNMISLPWTVSEAQLVVGSIFVLSLWLFRLRQAPGLTVENIEGLMLVAFCHVCSHVSAVICLGAGAMSIVPVVKATEPLFTALLSAAFWGQRFSLLVYLTLIPVMSGVALAYVKELDFNWAALGVAMGSNLAASTRLILSKRQMGMDMGKNMTPANLYAVLTIMAASILLPLTVLFEGPKIQSVWEATVDSSEKRNEIIFNTVASGVFFYLYNEVAFRCLGVVHPLTHSVGNTFKRVLIITISRIIFKTRDTSMAVVGSIMAILGVFLYSLAREWTSKA